MTLNISLVIGEHTITVPYSLHRFHVMSDIQIMQEFGVIIPYCFRAELIQKYMSYEAGDEHIFQFINTEPYIGMVSPISMDTIESGDEIYGVGSINKQQFYLLQDIIDAVNIDSQMQKPIVRISLPPLKSRPSVTFAEEISLLLELKGYLSMTYLLDMFIDQSEDPLSVDRSLISPELFPVLNNFLTNIIHIGLYARRWKGEGFPIPYATSATNTRVGIHEIRMNKLIHENSKILLIPSMVEVIGMILPFDYSKQHIHGNFLQMYTQMCDGKKCIREMAEYLISTGIHYSNTIYDTHPCINGSYVELSQFEFMNPIAPEEYPSL